MITPAAPLAESGEARAFEGGEAGEAEFEAEGGDEVGRTRRLHPWTSLIRRAVTR